MHIYTHICVYINIHVIWVSLGGAIVFYFPFILGGVMHFLNCASFLTSLRQINISDSTLKT